MKKLVEWRDDFSVGVQEIDEQHKNLFKILSELIEATGPGNQEEKIDTLLEDMVDYAEYHFTSEQAY